MIVLMGLAGSGKSTQADLLAKRLDCPWISTGQLLRDKISDPKNRRRMVNGEILSDDILLPLLETELERFQAERDELILDGSPRTMAQAEWLAGKIDNGQIKLTAIIHLYASKEVLKARLLKRGRPDDTEAGIAERFTEYDEITAPILSYWKSRGYSIHEIDADWSADIITANIQHVLGLA